MDLSYNSNVKYEGVQGLGMVRDGLFSIPCTNFVFNRFVLFLRLLEIRIRMRTR
jgi:hypothetical protein